MKLRKKKRMEFVLIHSNRDQVSSMLHLNFKKFEQSFGSFKDKQNFKTNEINVIIALFYLLSINELEFCLIN
jgi:hypothetical protein